MFGVWKPIATIVEIEDGVPWRYGPNVQAQAVRLSR